MDSMQSVHSFGTPIGLRLRKLWKIQPLGLEMGRTPHETHASALLATSVAAVFRTFLRSRLKVITAFACNFFSE